MIGVPSTASRLRTRSLRPSRDTTSTGWSPIGFGRSAEGVLITPVGLGGIITRMYAKDVAAGAIKPNEDDDPIPWTEVLETVEHAWLEHEPGLGRSLMALLRRRSDVGHGRLHPSDHHEMET